MQNLVSNIFPFLNSKITGTPYSFSHSLEYVMQSDFKRSFIFSWKKSWARHGKQTLISISLPERFCKDLAKWQHPTPIFCASLIVLLLPVFFVHFHQLIKVAVCLAVFWAAKPSTVTEQWLYSPVGHNWKRWKILLKERRKISPHPTSFIYKESRQRTKNWKF